MDEGELKSKILHSLKWVASMRLIGQLFSWLVTLLVIRLLAPEDYGTLALAQLLIGLALLLNEIGLTPALIQARQAAVETIASVHGFVLLSNVLLYAIVYGLAPAFAHFYGADELVAVIRVLALQLLIGAFGAVPVALAKRDLAFKHISLIGFASTLFGSLASLVIALLDGGVWALVSATLVMGVVQSFGIIVITRFNVAPSLRIGGLRKLLTFGAWVSGSRMAWFFAQSADDLIIGKMFNNEILGHFNVAKNLAALPMNRIMEIINQVIFPMYSRLDGDAGRALNYCLKSMWLATLVLCPISWGLSSVVDVFIEVVLGEKWLPAAFALRVICLSIPLQALSFLLTPVIDALGRPDLGFRNSVARLIIFPAAVVAALPWGLDGICVSFVIARAITLLMFFRIANAVFPLTLKRVWQAVQAPVLAGGAMYGAVTFALGYAGTLFTSPILLAAAIAGGALVYVVTLTVLAPHTFAEFKSTFNLG